MAVTGSGGEAPFIAVEDLTKHFRAARGLFANLSSGRGVMRAVDGVTFNLRRGEMVGLVGESGSGKTTVGRLLLKLTEPSSGRIQYGGRAMSEIVGHDLTAFRRRAQLIFQNPFEAINPRFTIGRALAEPLVNAGIGAHQHRALMERALDLARFAAGKSMLDRHPHHLSGGQLQRVVIARALILDPEFIVADEPVSMLDVSVRAGILNLLRAIGRELSLTAIFISHDLSLVRYLCARTIVMYRGVIVEDGPTADIIAEPLHPYTRALVAAVPTANPDQSRAPLPIVAKPSATAAAGAHGCRFADRCPRAMEICRVAAPKMAAPRGHRAVACHLY